jgi:HlyD family secretion protein
MEAALREMTDLTPAQRQEVEAAGREMRERMANLPAEPEARRQQAQAARQRLQSRLNAVLTPEQRARLAATRGTRQAGGAAGTVYVVEGDGAPRAIAIRTGLTDGNVTEVLSGELQPEMQVVIGAERAGTAPARAPTARPLF